MGRVKQLEAKESEREKYIMSLEKQLRSVTDENERMKADSNHNDKTLQTRIKEVERDLMHMSEQNVLLTRVVQEKDASIA